MEAPPQSAHLLLSRLCLPDGGAPAGPAAVPVSVVTVLADGTAPAGLAASLLRRLCSQIDPPPQSLQSLLARLCSQKEVEPQSLHRLLSRLCSQMELPPHLLNDCLLILCSQMEQPPQSTHRLLRRSCGHFFLGYVVPAVPSPLCVSGSSRPPPSPLATPPLRRHLPRCLPC